jgi:hypothetical protein
MRRILDYVYWTYLFKLIKDNKNKYTNETDWINLYCKKNYTRPNI